MQLVTPPEAIRAIPDGSTVIFPHECVEPTTLYTAFQHEVERFPPADDLLRLGVR
jgi:hypothetical protein